MRKQVLQQIMQSARFALKWSDLGEAKRETAFNHPDIIKEYEQALSMGHLALNDESPLFQAAFHHMKTRQNTADTLPTVEPAHARPITPVVYTGAADYARKRSKRATVSPSTAGGKKLDLAELIVPKSSLAAAERRRRAPLPALTANTTFSRPPKPQRSKSGQGKNLLIKIHVLFL